MSIFSTLKYPISDPPLLEELQDLPTNVVEEWMKGYHTNTFSMNKLHSLTVCQMMISNLYIKMKVNQSEYKSALESLRTMIFNLDE